MQYYSLAYLHLQYSQKSLHCFPGDVVKKISYCTNKGWNYSTDTKNKIPSFTVDITSDVTYHDKLIDTLLFMFDDSGNLAAQAVFFEDVLDSTHSFPAVLDLLIADHAQLLSKDFDSGNSYGLNFSALLNNNVSAKYGIRGKDNIYRISILYFKN